MNLAFWADICLYFIMDDIVFLTRQLEYIFLKKIIDDLRAEKMSVAEAKKNANDFLAIEPFTTSEETYIKIMDFVKQHGVFTELKTHMNNYQKEKSERAKVAKIQEHLRKNNIDAAIAVAKA
jgi:hypothetical protein